MSDTSLLHKFVSSALNEIRNDQPNSRILYRIDWHPAREQPSRWADHNWRRPWLDDESAGGIFMTNNPESIAANHGIRGHVYAYRVPEWAIADSGGLNRYDYGSEVLISNKIWKKMKDSGELKFLGKSMSYSTLKSKVKGSNSDWDYRYNQGSEMQAKRDPEYALDHNLARMSGLAKMVKDDPDHAAEAVRLLSPRQRHDRLKMIRRAKEMRDPKPNWFGSIKRSVSGPTMIDIVGSRANPEWEELETMLASDG